ncbi:alpha/beta fold hydrolase [Streptomyces sp. NPDC018964]|uniref:alpha/beta fold hydrolase n=1 Tax=Streptomyces sp. NPDC018964 TaxID=3365058 RepID=UPI003799002E
MQTKVSRTAAGTVYDVVGSGERTLLLLHGGSGRRQWFDPMAALLSDGMRMIRPDMPGHGESAATPGSYRLEDSAAAMAEVLDHFGSPRCWVVGHSHGAHVGAVLAEDRPDLVAGLVIGDAPMDRDRMLAHMRSTYEINRSWRALTTLTSSERDVRDGFLALEVPTPRGTTASVADLFGERHPYVREMAASLFRHDGDFLDAVTQRFDETYHRLDAGLLGRLNVPVALLRADPAAGGLLTDGDVKFVEQWVPDVRIEQLHDVGHGLQLQDPEQVAHALRKLIEGSWASGFPAPCRPSGGRQEGGSGEPCDAVRVRTC